jgi:hypothetical protein
VIEKAQATTGWTGGGLHAPTNPKGDEVPSCGILVQFTTDGFKYDEEATDPTDGIFNCDEANVLELQGDYGVPRPGA